MLNFKKAQKLNANKSPASKSLSGDVVGQHNSNDFKKMRNENQKTVFK